MAAPRRRPTPAFSGATNGIGRSLRNALRGLRCNALLGGCFHVKHFVTSCFTPLAPSACRCPLPLLCLPPAILYALRCHTPRFIPSVCYHPGCSFAPRRAFRYAIFGIFSPASRWLIPKPCTTDDSHCTGPVDQATSSDDRIPLRFTFIGAAAASRRRPTPAFSGAASANQRMHENCASRAPVDVVVRLTPSALYATAPIRRCFAAPVRRRRAFAIAALGLSFPSALYARVSLTPAFSGATNGIEGTCENRASWPPLQRNVRRCLGHIKPSAIGFQPAV